MMEKISGFVIRKSGPFSTRQTDACLPTHTSTKPRPKFQVKALLGHCLYRRVVIWTLSIFALLTVVLFDPHLTTQSRNVLRVVHGSKSSIPKTPITTERIIFQNQESIAVDAPKLEAVHQVKLGFKVDAEEDDSPNGIPHETSEDGRSNTPNGITDNTFNYIPSDDPGAAHEDAFENTFKSEIPKDEKDTSQDEEDTDGPKWLRYNHRPTTSPNIQNRRSPIRRNQLQYRPTIPSYRNRPFTGLSQTTTLMSGEKNYVAVNPCYVDSNKKVLVPDLYAYRGLIQGQPEAAIGSHEALGLRSDVCFDRFGRYGPYGLGYSLDRGGLSESLDIESEDSETVWEQSGQINWNEVDWAEAQDRCFSANQGRFFTGNKTRDAELAATGRKKLYRTAIVVRTYVGFKWTAHAVLNFRAMISELNLQSGGEYDVHFLLHVRDNNAPIWADIATAQEIIDRYVPPEFHGLCTLWSEAQMKLYYPGNFGDTYENPSNADIHGVYRSAHMPLQHFAMMHPEYEHFWNWEMDMRWTGSYYELFDRLGKWGAKQSRVGAWERSAKYYIPGLHGTWENFTELVNSEIQASNRRPLLGPVTFAGKLALNQGENFMPASCASGSELSQCGVGEEADLITLNPLFDADESGWVFAGDVTGYQTALPKPPRRCSIVTASRLSRRLLSVMHEETWRLHHSMFSEMFPSTMAFHHGLKAVFAPHPVFIDREWPQMEIDKAFNGGYYLVLQ
ncbi:hypothetical protein O1611_g3445 [Lasiodiplodia mahajangana]|uniref:Uncharacterized protein n=1 Tax=Lasiodiplodia mahajangana TaxID=1108764 RepID=A0ACC2JRS7_9PEZI|nr:hypothetical protein O1611_g3445 [Lasiodiplodia mahajangana]